jgi:GTP pyrophosphokinase
VSVSWAPDRDAAFLVAVQVEGIDRAGMLSDVTRVLSELHMSIVSVSAERVEQGTTSSPCG